MSNNYIIVGREVGEAKYFLHPDQSIDTTRRENSIPLTVAYIGQRVVELSEHGALAEGSDDYEQVVREFKHALQVIEQPRGTLSDAEKEAIWQNTTVQLQWDSRVPVGDTDANTRIIVIPADNTHTVNIETLRDDPAGIGFTPPLTYPLDEALVLASQIKTILRAISSFSPDDASLKLSEEQQNALQDHVRQELLGRYKVADGETRPDVLSKQAVLEQKIVSYYRAVGIYITLMCK
ncbi:hypothetical protein [Pseudooctadecabacter jejudonensis]|uniref:Uncharacterized protein n=1 Tax=Pseudooctadecabacter jejudonensis TaxID=1391910 RepID=A0A1Y5TK36_9RHOB|nr:hypothetical protein [Pseudooctadecabacter jejudonensis]SLN62270.1 hypothetical protein PSJ8397_03305 [Pseudooctadecabacter jejudonensis]